MFDQYKLLATSKRGALVLLFVCTLAVLGLAGTTNLPIATSLSATSSGATTFITISGTAPMAYSVSRPDAETLLLNLPRVDAGRLAHAYTVATPLVANVLVERGAQPNALLGVQCRVSLRAPVSYRSQMDGNNLVLVLSPASAAATSTMNPAHDDSATTSMPVASATSLTPAAVETPQGVPSPTPTPTRPTSVSLGMDNSPQVTQGKQYGQSDFVGEPINLNVVNADIRDILNYITEQYGVNFVIDSSVGAVPVTVNVTDVPWNYALDAVLRANRLGIDVNGNILRVATIEVLATEAVAQQKITDARLDNSPLRTEFIRLNYARASGTLSQAAGSAGGYAGGLASGATAGAVASGVSVGGPASGASGGGDQGILPIIQRRLSRRGSIEIDARSNTLIVTDVAENLQAVRQLIALLDQPEPQVEIETRIVIAQRNFSRDLGVQLSAVALNPSRGGLGSFQTAPSTNNLSGLNPQGIPGGLAGSPQPSGSLGAAAANTIIGLTTGIFGTAQISALITAAESKGQAKIIATPRVTALNNRTAQIESGQQIPVQTALGTTGATVVSTTFVSVPLRLSITPQITDVGTVVLRVTVENNSLNRGIAISGVPGIDTQRMQSEVLVPDGGTTVMGGVLADSESESQERTPGVSSIPVLGNLFKRRVTGRNTSEILFFITPRIYRPDYQGRPTAGTVGTGTRSTTISQPVPLGNPPTNTPQPRQGQPADQPQVVTPILVQPSTATPAARP